MLVANVTKLRKDPGFNKCGNEVGVYGLPIEFVDVLSVIGGILLRRNIRVERVHTSCGPSDTLVRTEDHRCRQKEYRRQHEAQRQARHVGTFMRRRRRSDTYQAG